MTAAGQKILDHYEEGRITATGAFSASWSCQIVRR